MTESIESNDGLAMQILWGCRAKKCGPLLFSHPGLENVSNYAAMRHKILL